ncbi:hypothetical protein [Halegenticoccus tardaugens]|nr:hypothetical protein [Halegenticoccus tardaugens]
MIREIDFFVLTSFISLLLLSIDLLPRLEAREEVDQTVEISTSPF